MKENAPIRYYGSKGGFYNKIIEHFPAPDEYDIYIEPYGGSYIVGLKKPMATIEIYNDLEKNVYSLYKVLSDPDMFHRFKEKCDLILYNEDLRNEFKVLLKTDESIEDRAFHFFYVNRTSHNGMGGFSINSHIRRGMSKAISDFLSSIDRLPELHDRLSRVMVTNMDGVRLIRKYKEPNTLLYCDPPYEQSTRTGARYAVDMNEEEHSKFLDAVIDSKSKIIISGYECKLYERLTDNGFKKINFEVNTMDGNFNKKVKTESLWLNY
jgi:DNA adenine methylase